MKNILGLDLGTNSIGWAVVQRDDLIGAIPKISLGSRIIPMSQDVIDKFGNGVTESQAAVRTAYRGMRRLRERTLLRRERLFRIFHILGFLPQHFDCSIGWDRKDNKTYGMFITGEPKLAYAPTEGGKPSFLFRTSFEEMLSDFSKKHPEMTANGKKIPYDWTLYYLRKKALTSPISKYELAWIILRFNQKRGYYQLRGEEQETEGKRKEYAVLTIASVEATDEKRAGNVIYKIKFKNGMEYLRPSRNPLDNLVGKEVEYIITTDVDENGQEKLDKEGNVKRSFSSPGADDWSLKKKRTESFIEDSGLSVGEYIYNCLLDNPEMKINGGYVQTIERKYYLAELRKILEKQAEYIPELRDARLLDECLSELYRTNEKRRESLREKGMIHLILNDTLFYQRPLKTKKSEIADCKFEHYTFVDKETGEIKTNNIKCVAKSNPYYQEFRLWQFVWNLRLYTNSGINEDNVTDKYLPTVEDRQKLFIWLNDKASVKQEELLSHLGIKKGRGKDSVLPVRWNYVADKTYPCNETRATILKYLKKANISSSLIDDFTTLYNLWHILYSVDIKDESAKALRTFAQKHQLPSTFSESFMSFPPIKKEYGAYSEKAIRKLLPLLEDGVQLWDAEERIYGKKANTDKWESPAEMKRYIDEFKNGSLRNPIVEQCIMESLRTVHDIWEKFGHIDEIHVELGREMKNPADKRKKMMDRIQENENTNMRIKTMLAEFKRESMPGVRPNSPMQQDILRIYEEGALQTLSKDDADYKDIYRISRLATPTATEVTRYKLWLEQRYRSPYTGQIIPLSRLFTSDYEIEHIIPRSRFFDDSFNNKVICESEVNRLKGNMLGMEFIKSKGGQIVETTHGKVHVLDESSYEKFIEDFYRSNKTKGRNLRLEDIPMEFVQRQMNDSRYISRVVKSILSAIVREDGETEETSKHVIVCSGPVTDRLKKDWGLNDVWNTLVYPRFERMNELTQSNAFGQWESKGGKRVFQTNMPLELSGGFRKKRIDHRHHAMDALVIACASRNIINFLNNESAHDAERREDLKRLLMSEGLIIKPWKSFTQDARQALSSVIVSFKNTVRVLSSTVNMYEHYDEKTGKKVRKRQEGNNFAIRKPLHKETFYGHVNLRKVKSVSINDAIKHPEDIRDKEIRTFILDLYAKQFTEKQIKSFLKDANYRVNRKDIKKVDVYYMTDEDEPLVATRKTLDDSFDEKKISTITDTGIQKILIAYLHSVGNDPKVAFSPEGIMRMNENIAAYNGGKPHKPILKVRKSDKMGEKFAVGHNGNKKDKYVKTQSGTNLYYSIYQSEDGKREYATTPLSEVIERMKQGLSPVVGATDSGATLLFYLSPNDLVYVPTDEEKNSNVDIADINPDQIYKLIKTTDNRSFYIPHRYASVLYNVSKSEANKFSNGKLILNEISIGNSSSVIERSLDGQIIREVCWKLITDRLGNITKIIR